MKKIINPIIYSLLAIGLAFILATHRLPLFLHPKMSKYVVFLFVGAIGLSLYGWWGIVKALISHETIAYHFKWTKGAFLMLFLMITLINPKDINLSISENKASSFFMTTSPKTVSIYNPNQDETGEVVLATESEDQPNALNPSDLSQGDQDQDNQTTQEASSSDEEEIFKVDGIDSDDSDSDDSDSNDTSEANQNLTNLPSPLAVDNLNQDDFLEIVDGIGADPEAHIGETITLEGFVYREDNFEENAFVVGRLVIACCAADSTVGGIYVQGLNANQFETDSWVRVTGTISKTSLYFKDIDMTMETAMIQANSIEAITPYDSPYVYMTY